MFQQLNTELHYDNQVQIIIFNVPCKYLINIAQEPANYSACLHWNDK